MERLIETYGYLAVLLGTFIEGETVLVLASFAAHRGYLHLPLVIATAFAGGFGGDLFYYYLGRRHRQAFLGRFPSWEARLLRARRLIDRHRVLIILGSRFLYGLRTVIPFAIGSSGVSLRRFTLLSATGALAWASLFGLLGYLFGEAMEVLVEDLRTYEPWVIGGIAVTGLAVWLVTLLVRAVGRRRGQGTGHEDGRDDARAGP
jgi:membrane protein DedA with SNARE-associated domain